MPSPSTLRGWGWASAPRLTRVDDDVLGEVPHVHKGLAADAALVGPDVVVVADVVGQLAGLDKPGGGGHTCHPTARPELPAHLGLAGKRLSCPGHWGRPLPLLGRRGRAASPLAAALADVGLLAGVLPHVRNEGAGLGEGLSADQALAGLLAWGERGKPSGAGGEAATGSSPGPASSSALWPRSGCRPGEGPGAEREACRKSLNPIPSWAHSARPSSVI